MTRCQNEFTLSRLAPLLIVARMNAPSSGPCTEPMAPNSDVPPITDDAIVLECGRIVHRDRSAALLADAPALDRLLAVGERAVHS